MGGVTSRSGTRPEAERRQITVLFVDMVGYTPLAEGLTGGARLGMRTKTIC